MDHRPIPKICLVQTRYSLLNIQVRGRFSSEDFCGTVNSVRKPSCPETPFTISMEHTSAERRSWIKRYRKTGNVSQVCTEFGISRPTFYKWLHRSDPDKSSKPLRSQSRRPHTKPLPTWGERELTILAQVDYETHGRLSAVRLSEKLGEHRVQVSRSTVERMLAKIRKCPICSEKDRLHDAGLHMLRQDLREWTRNITIAEHASTIGAGDGGAAYHALGPMQCQSKLKSGYRQCKNQAESGRPFCREHQHNSPAVQGLRNN